MKPMTVNEMKETDRIIIVGGGIGGMVTALCLEHLNIPYVLVEMNGPGEHQIEESGTHDRACRLGRYWR
jgi:2-polyprenyl-6-methoxyphenol hydroxylase-like FAD-dependent oxidoreductase